jgi:hypothetical protein
MNWKTVILKDDAEFINSDLARELSYGNHVGVIDDLSPSHFKIFKKSCRLK